MKPSIALISILLAIALPAQILAAKGGEKGPSDRAWERANDNASFKRGEDRPGKGHYKEKKKHKDSYDDERHDRDRENLQFFL